MVDRIDEMLAELENAPPEIKPSKFWQELNHKNIRQLEESGYDNFKRTVAQSYFTWLVSVRDPQMRNLLTLISPLKLPFVVLRSAFQQRHDYFTLKQSLWYNSLTFILWQYLLDHDQEKRADRLTEPEEGNPPRITWAGKLISQDLANSILEYKSIMNAGIDRSKVHHIMELGSGYGRDGYVFLKLMPGVKYTFVDIPPALYMAERYISNQFQDRRMFKFRPFRSYSEIKDEYESAEIAFLEPHQLAFLPDKSVDLFINISSLHEMRHDQIAYYLQVIDRLTSGWFYMKEWQVSRNAVDNIVVRQEDYPIPEQWTKVYWRHCAVQIGFFEALLAL
jgi:putative sugar O-methyltransferase